MVGGQVPRLGFLNVNTPEEFFLEYVRMRAAQDELYELSAQPFLQRFWLDPDATMRDEHRRERAAEKITKCERQGSSALLYTTGTGMGRLRYHLERAKTQTLARTLEDWRIARCELECSICRELADEEKIGCRYCGGNGWVDWIE